jgi:hypothetical protein
MAAPTNAANVKKALANSEPSTHGTFLPFVALQHHGSYRGYRRHVADGTGRPSLDGDLNRSTQHLLILLDKEVADGDVTDIVHGEAEG